MFDVKKASEFDNPKQMVQSAFRLFQEVYKTLPKQPISILPRDFEAFKPDQTIIAAFDENVLGVVLLDPGPEFNSNHPMYSSNAADVLKAHYPDVDINEIFMASSMAILSTVRNVGIGEALLEKAKELSGGKCIGVCRKDSSGGRLCKKVGFQQTPHSTFSNRYNIEDDKHYLDSNGEHVVKWNLFTHFQP